MRVGPPAVSQRMRASVARQPVEFRRASFGGGRRMVGSVSGPRTVSALDQPPGKPDMARTVDDLPWRLLAPHLAPLVKTRTPRDRTIIAHPNGKPWSYDTLRDRIVGVGQGRRGQRPEGAPPQTYARHRLARARDMLLVESPRRGDAAGALQNKKGDPGVSQLSCHIIPSMSVLADYERFDGLGWRSWCGARRSPRRRCSRRRSRGSSAEPEINAVVTRMYDQARAAVAAGLPAGPFTGVPYLLKDLGALYAGAVTTYGSRALHALRRRPRQRDHRAAQAGRTRDRRQDEHAGVRDRADDRAARCSVRRATRGTRPQRRRFERRRGRGRRGGHGADGARQRRRRLDPHPGVLLRSLRPQADPRAQSDRARRRRGMGRRLRRPRGDADRSATAPRSSTRPPAPTSAIPTGRRRRPARSCARSARPRPAAHRAHDAAVERPAGPSRLRRRRRARRRSSASGSATTWRRRARTSTTSAWRRATRVIVAANVPQRWRPARPRWAARSPRTTSSASPGTAWCDGRRCRRGLRALDRIVHRAGRAVARFFTRTTSCSRRPCASHRSRSAFST